MIFQSGRPISPDDDLELFSEVDADTKQKYVIIVLDFEYFDILYFFLPAKYEALRP